MKKKTAPKFTLPEDAPERWWMDHPLLGTEAWDDPAATRQHETYAAIANLCLGSVLDIGCNTGILSWFLNQTLHNDFPETLGNGVVNYTGVDSNPQAVAFARERGLNVAEGNLRALDFPDQEFGTVVLKDVISHLGDFKLLAEAFRVAQNQVVVANYIPWGIGESGQNNNGIIEMRYDLTAVDQFAVENGFDMVQILETDEAGKPNQVILFVREIPDDSADNSI